MRTPKAFAVIAVLFLCFALAFSAQQTDKKSDTESQEKATKIKKENRYTEAEIQEIIEGALAEVEECLKDIDVRINSEELEAKLEKLQALEDLELDIHLSEIETELEKLDCLQALEDLEVKVEGLERLDILKELEDLEVHLEGLESLKCLESLKTLEALKALEELDLDFDFDFDFDWDCDKDKIKIKKIRTAPEKK